MASSVADLVQVAVEAARPALEGRRILVGVSGGIAAYKAAELVRLLVRAGAQVRAAMTQAASEFIGPLTLQSLSGHSVARSVFDLQAEATIGHIELADWAELVVLAPATADLLARMAQGRADDVVTTILLATKAPVLIAPAMNVNMWQHPATVENLRVLRGRGTHQIGPDPGDLACGWVGQGRMAEPVEILAAAAGVLGPRVLSGERVLVTAGPTHEAIDPVRYISNRSTGKMGFAVAAEAAARGAKVTLVAGPTPLPTPAAVERVDVVSAAELREAVLARCDDASIVVMAAAVADERPSAPASHKLKKRGERSRLEHEPTADILVELGARTWARRPILVGFAAETEQVVEHAKEKLEKKRCDLVVANDVGATDAGFAADDNRVILVRRGVAPEALPLLPKRQVAGRILDAVQVLRRG